jgi:hypothetical protein
MYGDPNFRTTRYNTVPNEEWTRAKRGISDKVKWDGQRETFQAYDRYIIGHCKQNGLGYQLNPHFMTLYLRYGWRILEMAPQYKRENLSLEQLKEDIELLNGIPYSIFNTSIGVQLFQSDEPVDGYYDGIRMYLKVANKLGPNIRTQFWNYERATQETYHPRAAGGIKGFVRRYQTVYSEF